MSRISHRNDIFTNFQLAREGDGVVTAAEREQILEAVRHKGITTKEWLQSEELADKMQAEYRALRQRPGVDPEELAKADYRRLAAQQLCDDIASEQSSQGLLKAIWINIRNWGD